MARQRYRTALRKARRLGVSVHDLALRNLRAYAKGLRWKVRRASLEAWDWDPSVDVYTIELSRGLPTGGCCVIELDLLSNGHTTRTSVVHLDRSGATVGQFASGRQKATSAVSHCAAWAAAFESPQAPR